MYVCVCVCVCVCMYVFTQKKDVIQSNNFKAQCFVSSVFLLPDWLPKQG